MLVRSLKGLEVTFSGGETIVQINIGTSSRLAVNGNGRCDSDVLTRPFRKTSIRCPNLGSSWWVLPVTKVFFRQHRTAIGFDRSVPTSYTTNKAVNPIRRYLPVFKFVANHNDRA